MSTGLGGRGRVLRPPSGVDAGSEAPRLALGAPRVEPWSEQTPGAQGVEPPHSPLSVAEQSSDCAYVVSYYSSQFADLEGDGLPAAASVPPSYLGITALSVVRAKRRERDQGRNLRRAIQSCRSGVECSTRRLRIMELSSSPVSPWPIEASYRLLLQNLGRQGIRFDYFKVTEFTRSGLPHLHILFRGDFIRFEVIKTLWGKIHNSPHVYIQATHGDQRHISNYLCKYLSKQIGEGLSSAECHCYDVVPELLPVFMPKFRKMWSYSQGWVYPRFRAAWQFAVRIWAWSQVRHPSNALDIRVVIGLWEMHLRGDSMPSEFLGWVAAAAGWSPLDSRGEREFTGFKTYCDAGFRRARGLPPVPCDEELWWYVPQVKHAVKARAHSIWQSRRSRLRLVRVGTIYKVDHLQQRMSLDG